MQLNIPNTKKIVSIFILLFLFSGCSKKDDLDNQITIKITSIDSKTKQPRVNMFDTVIVRREGIGYLKKTYTKIGEYITDSTGSVKIKVDNNKGYKFLLKKRGFYGTENYSKPFNQEKLKNGQNVNIEAIPIK